MWWLLWEACWDSSGLGGGVQEERAVQGRFNGGLGGEWALKPGPDFCEDGRKRALYSQRLNGREARAGELGFDRMWWRELCQPVWEQEVDIKSCDAEWLSMGGDSGNSM